MLSRYCCGLLALCTLFAACDTGGSATPAVAGVAAPALVSGEVPIEIWLLDLQSDPVDIELLYSIDDRATWSTATVRSTATGLATAPLGVRHILLWDALADLGARADLNVDLSVRATESVSGNRSFAFVRSVKLENLQAAARRVEHYMIYFGPLDPAKIAIAETHDLVILYSCDPSITRSVVAEIQDGIDPEDPRDDVIVLGYVNVGEDDRTIGISDGDLLLESRFVGDGSGPRLDPRGAGAAGQSLTGLDPLGLPSVSGGYASYYLDDNSLETNGIGDGLPDRNGVTGACYVNMGDPAWFTALDEMQCASADARNGFRELLTLDYGLGLGCDGVYLDNVDTCAPNTYTGPGDPDQAEFEWTAAGYAGLVDELRTQYPSSLIMQNRGLFFFNPELDHYELTTRSDIDFLKIESYRLDRQTGTEFDAYTFADNKFNFAPKVQAEAYRQDGFQVLSLGYAEGPGIDYNTLLGTSTGGLSTLQQDIVEAQNLAGFRHYLLDNAGSIVNQFVRDQADFSDTTAPEWTSTYNVNNPGYPTPPTAAIPRVGVQQVVADVEAVKVRWDVALDLNPVRYVLYYDDKDFNFNDGDEKAFKNATRVELLADIGSSYAGGVGPNVFPYEAIITGLKKNKAHYFCIRAIDSVGNEDSNQVVLSTTTLSQELSMAVDGDFDDWDDVPKLLKDKKTKDDSSGPDWKEIRVINDTVNLYLHVKTHDRFNLDGSPGFLSSQLKILIDVDNDPFTGFPFSNIGSELMVHGDQLIAQTIAQEDAGVLQALSVNPTSDSKEFELAVPLAAIDSAFGGLAGTVRLIFIDADSGDLAPDSGYLEYKIAR